MIDGITALDGLPYMSPSQARVALPGIVALIKQEVEAQLSGMVVGRVPKSLLGTLEG